MENPKNLTTANLKRELTVNISFPSTDRHAVLVSLYQIRANMHTIGAPEAGNDDPIIPTNDEDGGAQSSIDRNTVALVSMENTFVLMTENIERLHKRLDSMEKQLLVQRTNESNNPALASMKHKPFSSLHN